MPEKKFNFKLGSDPEFSFVLQGRRCSAYDLLNSNLSRKKEFQKEEQGYSCQGGEIGWDGCQATAELRPKPSNQVSEITKNFRSMLTELHQKLPTFDLSVLSTFAPVGGHIHFQISKELHNNKQKLQLLQKKVSSFFLPIMMSENKINLRLRTGASINNPHPYGTLTDYHSESDNAYLQTDGSTEYTYEFRTPSAEWLTTEKICGATFAYLGVVFHEISNNPKNFAKYMGMVYKNNDQAKSLHQLIITDYIGITGSLSNHIKKAVKTFELYPDFKEQIDYIFNPKKVMADKKKANYNIVDGWKLGRSTKFKKPSLSSILSDKKFKDLASKIDLDQRVMLMNISYNDDINVEFFVRTLAERAAAFDWKLKNSYFLFGMRKGLETQVVFNQAEEILAGKEVIKTEEDKSAMKELISRISGKFLSNQQKQINLMTGEIEKSNVTIIGLPYGMRVGKNYKDLISLIYQLEEGKIKPVAVDACYKDLINDKDLPESQKGSLYKYVFNIKSEEVLETETGVVYDNYSQGNDIAAANRANLIREIQADEVNNAESDLVMPIANLVEASITN